MKRFFRDMVGMFTRDWGLKLLSLTLALVIYYSLRPTEGSRHVEHDRSIFQSR